MEKVFPLSPSIRIRKPNTSKYKGNLNNLLKIEDFSDFYTKDEPDSWICFEFKNYKIIPTCYTLKSHNNSSGGCQPRTWIIEGSNDNQKWTKIDEQKNCTYLNDKNVFHTFLINGNEGKNPFKFMRIRQTGQNWCDSYGWRNILALSCIEFYGLLTFL